MRLSRISIDSAKTLTDENTVVTGLCTKSLPQSWSPLRGLRGRVDTRTSVRPLIQSRPYLLQLHQHHGAVGHPHFGSFIIASAGAQPAGSRGHVVGYSSYWRNPSTASTVYITPTSTSTPSLLLLRDADCLGVSADRTFHVLDSPAPVLLPVVVLQYRLPEFHSP